jgi:redox-sensing transcriptional repressor
VNDFTSLNTRVKRIADSTIRRLSLYLGFLEGAEKRGIATISSDELAGLGGTTSAQVRKDLSFFGSFGKRGLGYSVPELLAKLRGILGLEKEWKVCIIGAGQIGAALAHYRGFAERGFMVTGVYDISPAKIGAKWDGIRVRDVATFPEDAAKARYDIALVAVPDSAAQQVLDMVAKAGIRAVLNFASGQLNVPGGVTVRTMNMALELEALSFALTNRE